MWILKQEDDRLLYQVYEQEKLREPEEKRLITNKEDEYNELLRNYFRLDVDTKDCYSKWSLRDPYFKLAAKQFYGVRILNQNVVENIFSFICSSNNNIKRYCSTNAAYCWILTRRFDPEYQAWLIS